MSMLQRKAGILDELQALPVCGRRIRVRKSSEFLGGLGTHTNASDTTTVARPHRLKTAPLQVLLQHASVAFRQRIFNGQIDAQLPLAQSDSRDILHHNIGILNVKRAAQGSRTRESYRTSVRNSGSAIAAVRQWRINGKIDVQLPLAQRHSRSILQCNAGILNLTAALRLLCEQFDTTEGDIRMMPKG